MKYSILVLMLLVSFSLLLGQNVFVWDRDNGVVIPDPEDPWNYVGLEASLKNALNANGVVPAIDSTLAGDMTEYDIIFATAGIWCMG
ncbi:MAG: hypothetical protein K9N07_06180 [Candidatus Cloacimonetes bacterium]|nr:hypothetical protein [Candidatus Cloacimonadota bacterium]